MRPFIRQTRDPLDPFGVPNTQGMHLAYPIEPEYLRPGVSDVLSPILVTAALGLAITFTARFIAVATPVPPWLVPAATLLPGFWLIRSLVDVPPSLLRKAGYVIIAAALLFLGPFWFPLLALAVALCLAIRFAHRFTNHYASCLHANPFLDSATRTYWLEVWTALRPYPQGHKSPELRERASYYYGAALLFLAAMACVLAMLFTDTPRSGQPLSPLFTKVVAFAMPFVFLSLGTLNLLLYRPRRDPITAFRVFLRAVASWFWYNCQEVRAPGVFQSPSGSCTRRIRLALSTQLALTLPLLPLAAYFPLSLSPLRNGSERLIDTAMIPQSWQDYLPWNAQEPADPPLCHHIYVAPAECLPLVTLNGALHKDIPMLVSIPFTLLACLVYPPLLLYSICFALGSRRLYHHHLTLERCRRPEDEPLIAYNGNLTPEGWQACTAQLRESDFVTIDQHGRPIYERDHLLVGFRVDDGYPVLLHLDVVRGHVWITGGSGHGKTSLALAPLAAQLIGRPKTSVVVVDPKGDMALFENTRYAVHQANERLPSRTNGKPAIEFKSFTTRPHYPTYAFNPLRQSHMRGDDVTTHQRTEMLMQALGLNYGQGLYDDYGRSFFGGQHRHAAQKVLEANPNIGSLRELSSLLQDRRYLRAELNLEKHEIEHASHLAIILYSLAFFDALNVTDNDNPQQFCHQIEMDDVVTTPSVVYFHLPSVFEEQSAGEIAQLALYGLLTAAAQHEDADHEVFLFIDEFQKAAGKNIDTLLQMARSHRISLILANQSPGDMPAAIIPALESNTHYRQEFSTKSARQMKEWIEASPRITAELRSTSWNNDGTLRTNVAEHMDYLLNTTELIDMTRNQFDSLVSITKSVGFTQYRHPFVMRSCFHIPDDVYGDRLKTPWPSELPGTLTQSLKDMPAASRPQPRTPRTPPPPGPPVPSDFERRLNAL